MLNIRHRRPTISDEPRPSPEGEEVPCPVQHYDEAVSESDEEENVNEQPREPRDEAAAGAQAKAFADGVPTARVVRLPHAKHDVYASNEADVLREMNSFLANLP